jgi:hypothetical protein
MGRSLAASIETVKSATASLQGAASLNSMLARADEAAAHLEAREAALRSLPAPQGNQEFNTTLQIDSLSGKMWDDLHDFWLYPLHGNVLGQLGSAENIYAENIINIFSKPFETVMILSPNDCIWSLNTASLSRMR